RSAGCGAPMSAFRLDFALHDSELSVAIDIEKEVIIGDDALNDRAKDVRAQQAEFFAVDDGMDALLKGLHRAECVHGAAQEDEYAVAALRHRHLLYELQRQILLRRIAREKLLDEHDLILDAPEAQGEIIVVA